MKYISIFLAVLFIFAVGCSSSVSEKAAQKSAENMIASTIKANTGQDAKVEISDDSFSMKTKEGSMEVAAGSSAKIPADFPEDIYLWPEAKVNMAMQMPEGMTVSLQTPVVSTEVTNTYQKKMIENGWENTLSMDLGEQKMLTYSKDNRMAQIMIAKQDNETVINISTMKQ